MTTHGLLGLNISLKIWIWISLVQKPKDKNFFKKRIIENYDTFERLYITGFFLYFEISV